MIRNRFLCPSLALRGRHGRTLFPLVEPIPTVRRRPFLAVAAGPVGEMALAEAQSLPGRPKFVPLTLGTSPAVWQDAVESVLRHVGADALVQGRELVAVVVIGKPQEVAGAWPGLLPRLEAIRPGIRLGVVILELGEPPRASPGPDLPPYCFGRFALAREYANGRLSEPELTALAARLIRLDLTSQLFRFGLAHRVKGQVLLGATLGWLPEVPLGQAVAHYLAARLAQLVLDRPEAPAPRIPALFTPSSTAVLQTRLWSILDREGTTLIQRLRSDYRTTPVVELDMDSHAGQAQALAAAAAWCAEVRKSMLQTLAKLSDEAAALSLTHLVAKQAVQDLGQARQSYARREQQLAIGRQKAARLAKLQDERRLRARHSWLLVRPFVRWWRTRQTRKRLHEFARAQADELTVRCQALAIKRLQEELENVDARLTRFAAQAGTQHELLKSLLQPSHPAMLALQDPGSLEAMLQTVAESLLRSYGQPGVQEVWARAIPSIYQEHAQGDDPWSHVWRSAQEAAATIPRAALPLSSVCGTLFPRYRPVTLRTILARAARPCFFDEGGSPWAEQQIFLDEESRLKVCVDGDMPRLPAVLCFRWRV